MSRLLVLVFLVGALILGWSLTRETATSIDTVLIKGRSFTVEVADTDAERIQGLSGRDSLGSDEGMIFLMPYKDRHVFWMKEMKFPLDIIWLDGEMVVGVSHDVPPPLVSEGEIARVSPVRMANMVLEINAGIAKELGIVEGDKVLFSRGRP